jgi:hypothetical protein
MDVDSKSPAPGADLHGGAAANAAAVAAAALAAMAQGMPLPPLGGLPALLGGLPPGMAAPLGGLGKPGAAGMFNAAPPAGVGFAGLPGFGAGLPGMPLCPPDVFGGALFPGLPGVPGKGVGGAAPGAAGGSRMSLDSVLHGAGGAPGLGASGRRSFENPAIQSVRAGPRIFIGKLTKDTSEADVKEYFGRFGFVTDVYMPKAKDNKAEHRGFGFVTFETDDAIKRVVGAGTHKLKGSTIAIDIAMPKLDEELGGGVDGLGPGAGAPAAGGFGGLGAALPASGAVNAAALGHLGGGMAGRPLGPPQLDAMTAGMMAAAAAAQQYNVRASMPLV